jgi:AcrR family transcriptional regulator
MPGFPVPRVPPVSPAPPAPSAPSAPSAPLARTAPRARTAPPAPAATAREDTSAIPSRRAQILDAALAAFTEHGVAGASIEDIRRRSGASVGSIYHHFGGKDGIAGALYLEGIRDYQQGLLEVLSHASSTRDGIEGAVNHLIGWIAEHRELAWFLLLGRDAGIVPASETELRKLNRDFFGAVNAWVRPRVGRGELRDLKPEVLTALWIGPSHDLARHWLAGRSRVPLPEAATALAGAAWTCLKEE